MVSGVKGAHILFDSNGYCEDSYIVVASRYLFVAPDDVSPKADSNLLVAVGEFIGNVRIFYLGVSVMLFYNLLFV